jgi:hypothetical protein
MRSERRPISLTAPAPLRDNGEVSFVRALQFLALASLAAIAAPLPAFAQTMFLDVTGDGVCDSRDFLTSRVTSVDLYLATDRNADASEAVCADESEPLSLFGYEFILRAWGEGTVSYGTWIPAPAVADFTASIGPRSNETDYYTGFITLNSRPPGRYRLGSLEIKVTGTPRLSLVSSTPMGSGFRSGFASECPGQDSDNALKLGTDFTDACGTAPAAPRTSSTWETVRSLYPP